MGEVERNIDESKGLSICWLHSAFGGLLYNQCYHRVFMAAIHQQLAESFFSKPNTCLSLFRTAAHVKNKEALGVKEFWGIFCRCKKKRKKPSCRKLQAADSPTFGQITI